MKKYFFLLPVAGLCLIVGQSSQSSSAPQEAVRPQKPLQYEVKVTVRLIQVIVIDKQGKPVTDLRKEDFVLTDNGQEMKLTEFEKHLLSLPSVEKPAEERVAATPLPAPGLLTGSTRPRPIFSRSNGARSVSIITKSPSKGQNNTTGSPVSPFARSSRSKKTASGFRANCISRKPT